MEIRPIDNDCGAEIDGVDLQSMSDEEVEAIADAQAAYGVVFLRGQTLTPDQQLAAARRFGPINVNRFFTPVPGHPQVAMVLKEPRHKQNVGGGWHTDHSYDEAPALGSMLFALEVPSAGGDTLFASMYKAYEALSPGLRRTLAGLSAVHSSRHVFGKSAAYAKHDDDRYHNAEKATQDAVHPVVIRHPRTGRAALYVNPAFTVRILPAGRMTNRVRYSNISMASLTGKITPAGSAGRSVASRSGTIARPGTTRSTITPGSGA